VNYIDEDGKQRFKCLDSRECFPIYDNTLNQNLLCVVRYYPVDMFDSSKGFHVDIYTESAVDHYFMNTGYSSLRFENSDTHYYGQVPVTVFSLNQEEESIFDKVLTL
jgi:SPP1 family phage portal protein